MEITENKPEALSGKRKKTCIFRRNKLKSLQLNKIRTQ